MLKNVILLDEETDKLTVAGNYASAAEMLLNMQLEVWKPLKENFETLSKVKEKSFLINGFRIKVQYNPARIKSTSADVSEEALNNRQCFLCFKNLPAEQKGILFLNEYLLLCNPYPIFSKHFTITCLQHKPQRIQKSFKEFSAIAKLLSIKYALIYNGPQCGASAPNHLHFQAAEKLCIPIFDDIQQLKNEKGKILFEEDENTISAIDDGLRTIILIESMSKDKLAYFFQKFYRCYTELTGPTAEPMMNILCNYDDEFGFCLIIFLRSRHRPGYFYINDERKILVSPAAIDLGGVLIAPREEDFNKTNGELLQEIFIEVSLNKELFSLLAQKLKEQFD